jgi:hypothetical protein
MPISAFSARSASFTPRRRARCAEVELAEVALEVLGADVCVGADQAALEDREVALDRVGVPEATAHVLFDGVVDGAMPAETLATGG